MAAKERKGLGAGLDALFGSDENDVEESELQLVPISKVEPRAAQPREYFDEKALQDLADSIEQYGLIQPITVRKLSTGYYQIIAGERRWRASRLAGLSEVPVRIIDADDRRTAELALVENLQRQDLNPIEEAKGYQTLIGEYGLTQEQTAKSVGKSRPAVTNALRLLSLSAPVLEMVEKGTLSAGHARTLVVINSDAKQLEAANSIIKKGLSVRGAEQLASKINSGNVEIAAKEPNEIDYSADMSEQLTKALGRKVRIVDGRRSGRIELEYYGSDDREALIKAIKQIAKR